MKPTIPDVRPLVTRLYQGEDPCSLGTGGVGGHLHIVLDDGNIEDGHVAFCLEAARQDHCATCLRLAALLVQMSKTQRTKLSGEAGR